ncbi:MAG: sensor histidine kinase [Actinomycetes bacterium]
MHDDTTIERALRTAGPHVDASDVLRHELTSPLTALRAAIETVRRHGTRLTAEQVDEVLASARRNVDRLEAVAASLVGLPLPDPVPAPGSPGSGDVQLRAWLPVVVGDVAGPMPVAVTVTGDPRVRSGGVDLETVVRNLVTNALKYGGHPVAVTAELRDGRVELAVSDEGPGVPEDFEPHLFTPHHRAAQTAATRPGSGLGLALARAAAGRLGGTLHHERRKGTTRFVALLPPSVPRGRPSPAAPVRPVAAGISAVHDGHTSEVSVELAARGRRAMGRACSDASRRGIARAAADATASALTALLRDCGATATVVVSGVELGSDGPVRRVTVGADLHTDVRTDHLVGAARLDPDLPDAVCRATLSATNRRVSALLDGATFSG